MDQLARLGEFGLRRRFRYDLGLLCQNAAFLFSHRLPPTEVEADRIAVQLDALRAVLVAWQLAEPELDPEADHES